MVGALLHFIHQVVLKIQAERLALLLTHAHRADGFAVLPEHLE